MSERTQPASDESRDHASTARGADDDGAALADLPRGDVTRYQLNAEHGRGGLGRVVRASDRHLGREVAIKELLRHDDPEIAARFVREALVTARLQHPAIVPIYDAGRWPDGAPFYVMKLVTGQNLLEALSSRATLADRLALVPRVHAAAEAVAYAHSRGVIHRDLKPANLMLGPFGETFVVDWGLAKDLDVAAAAAAAARAGTDDAYVLAHHEMTRDGAIVGTPAYMPPEQAEGRSVDARADVFALGAMLYHVLAGRPPFPGGMLRDEAPPALTDALPAIPRDLVAIVDKAMSADPDARYPTAGELADDLQRFLAGRLVAARSYGRVSAALRALTRRRVSALVAAALVVLLIGTAVVSVYRIVQARAAAEARADQLTLAQASAMIDRDPTAALAWIRRYPDHGADQVAARALAADAIGRGVARHVLGGHLEGASAAVWSPDGAWIASVDGATVRLWDAASGRLDAAWEATGAWQVAFAADGSALGVTGAQGHVWRIDVNARTIIELGHAPPWQDALVVSPDGTAVVARGSDGQLRRFVAGAPPIALGGDAQPGALAATRDGLVAASADGTIRHWAAPWRGAASSTELGRAGITGTPLVASDVVVAWAVGAEVIVTTVDGAEVQRRERLSGDVVALAVSAREVVAATADGEVWSTIDGAPWHKTALHGDDILRVAIGPRGELAAGDLAGTARVLDAGVVRALRGHRRPITSLAFEPRGSLLTGANDGAARIWLPPAALARRVEVGPGDVFALDWADATTVVAGTRDGGVHRLGDAAPSTQHLHRGAVYGLAIDPMRGRVITAGWDGQVIAWGATPNVLAAFGDRVWSMALDRATGRVAVAVATGEVSVIDVDGTSRALDRLSGLATAVAFSPDGTSVAWGGEHGEVRLATDRTRTCPGLEGRVASLVFSPDGGTLYAAGHDGRVVAWDVDAPEPIARELLRADLPVRALTVSDDGRWLVAGGQDRLVRVVDLARRTARVLRGHDAEVRAVDISDDGAWIVSAGWDSTVRLWRMPDGAQLVLRGHEGHVQRVSFSPDGASIASGGADGTVQRWSMEALRQTLPPPTSAARWASAATTAVARVGADVATPQAITRRSSPAE